MQQLCRRLASPGTLLRPWRHGNQRHSSLVHPLLCILTCSLLSLVVQHCACSLSSASAGARRRFQVVAQVDINPNGNLNCRLNFPDVPQLDSNIEHIEESVFDSIRAQVWMMSPPCQPFTRAGKCRDDQDERAKPLIRLIEVLTRLKFPPEFILLENVKGFEKSNCAKMLLKQLESLNFAFEQFLLTPTQFGIPNERLRYYLIARRKSKDQPKRSYFENNENVAMAFIPGNKFFSKPFQIYDLNQDDESDFPEEYCVARSDRPPVPSDHAIKSTFQLQEILEHPDDSFLVDPKLLLKSKGYCFGKIFYLFGTLFRNVSLFYSARFSQSIFHPKLVFHKVLWTLHQRHWIRRCH